MQPKNKTVQKLSLLCCFYVVFFEAYDGVQFLLKLHLPNETTTILTQGEGHAGPFIGFVIFFINVFSNRWSCSIILFKYFICLISIFSDSFRFLFILLFWFFSEAKLAPLLFMVTFFWPAIVAYCLVKKGFG